MKPAPFHYERPASLDEALQLLARHGDDGKILAGGQSLIPVMNFRLAQPAVLIDVNRLGELDFVTAGDDGSLRLGALVRQARLEREDAVARRAPLLAEAVPFVAHPQIRNRGTVGGSLAHADPAAELPAVMVALDARFRLARRAASAGWRRRTSSAACSPPPSSRARCWSRSSCRPGRRATAPASSRCRGGTATTRWSASRR